MEPAASQRQSQTIGVFGGSFDPPHLAHAMLIAYALSAYPMDRLLVIPAFRHPFAKPLAPYEHRVRMCELAMADLKRVQVSRVEQEIGGDSLTLRTLEELRRRLPHDDLRLVVGSDLLAETPRWHGFEEIRRIAPLIVVPRQGHPNEGLEGPALPPVSSTEIRRRLQQGLSTEGWLALSVAQYIQSHGLYR